MAKEVHPEDLLGKISGYLTDIEEVQLPDIEQRLKDIRSSCRAAQELSDNLEKWVYDQLT